MRERKKGYGEYKEIISKSRVIFGEVTAVLECIGGFLKKKAIS